MNTYTSPEDLRNGMVADIAKAINGEYTAIYCYGILAKQAPSPEIKERILEIRNDEIRHYHTFTQIYFSLTGDQPNPQVTEQCPNNYKDGVLAAFKDEQNTVDFYHEIARKYNNEIIRNAFTQASADEQNHAVWYLYFMNHS